MTAASLSGQFRTTRSRARLIDGRRRRRGSCRGRGPRRRRRSAGRRRGQPSWPGRRRWTSAGDPAAARAPTPARSAADRPAQARDPPGSGSGDRDGADRAGSALDERPAGLARAEELDDRPRELGLVQVAPDPRPLDEADLAALLADDDDDRVGVGGDPERGPMAGPEPLGLDGQLGQRQERAGGDDLLAADDDRPVVERGPRHEDRDEQVGRQVGVEHHPRLGDLLEARLALDHDERAMVLAGQQGRGVGDLGGHVLGASARRRARRARPSSRPGRSARAHGGARAGTRRRARTRRRSRPSRGSGGGAGG